MYFEAEINEEWIEEEDKRADILIDISDFADRHPEFDAEFLDLVRNQFDQNGKMPATQYNHLVKLYNQFVLE